MRLDSCRTARMKFKPDAVLSLVTSKSPKVSKAEITTVCACRNNPSPWCPPDVLFSCSTTKSYKKVCCSCARFSVPNIVVARALALFFLRSIPACYINSCE